MVVAAREVGLTVAVYSWGATEWTRMLAAAGSLKAEVEALVRDAAVWIDLHAHVKRVLAAGAGTSIKVIARAAGFEWRDPEATGMKAGAWFSAARRSDSDAASYLLAYNEDDVRATQAVRN